MEENPLKLNYLIKSIDFMSDEYLENTIEETILQDIVNDVAEYELDKILDKMINFFNKNYEFIKKEYRSKLNGKTIGKFYEKPILNIGKISTIIDKLSKNEQLKDCINEEYINKLKQICKEKLFTSEIYVKRVVFIDLSLKYMLMSIEECKKTINVNYKNKSIEITISYKNKINDEEKKYIIECKENDKKVKENNDKCLDIKIQTLEDENTKKYISSKLFNTKEAMRLNNYDLREKLLATLVVNGVDNLKEQIKSIKKPEFWGSIREDMLKKYLQEEYDKNFPKIIEKPSNFITKGENDKKEHCYIQAEGKIYLLQNENEEFKLYECKISGKSKKCPLKLINIEEEKQDKILQSFYNVFGVENNQEIINKAKELKNPNTIGL